MNILEQNTIELNKIVFKIYDLFFQDYFGENLIHRYNLRESL